MRMAKNIKQTSKKAASAASKALRNPRSGKASKILADVLLFYLKNTFCMSSRLSGMYSAIL